MKTERIDPTSSTAKRSVFQKVSDHFEHVMNMLSKDIWKVEYLGRSTLKARFYMVLRVLALTWQGLRRNRIPVQSAALTFYSLIGIGPLIAIGIMISSFILDKGDEDNMIVDAITQAISYAAPQLTLEVESGEANLAPELTEMVNSFITTAQSGTVGVVGSLMLFIIGIQVLSSIEGSFNSLWGVEKGRKIGERIVTYWTFISLGAVTGAASLTLVGFKAAKTFMEQFPFGGEFFSVILFFTPIIVFLLIVLLLGLFFRFIPNTKVHWIPAFTGAAVVVIALNLYNQFSFLYVQKVIDTRSLYGSVGIVVVLMLGLYVFWLLILFGGQLTYAVQNADFLTNESAWQKISERTKELVSLSILKLCAIRFNNGGLPVTASELHEKMRVPSHILNSSISRLCELGFLSAIESKTSEDERNRAYQPGRSMNALTLKQFKEAFECYGNNDGAEIIIKLDPSIKIYLNEIISLNNCDSAKMSITDLVTKSEQS